MCDGGGGGFVLEFRFWMGPWRGDAAAEFENARGCN